MTDTPCPFCSLPPARIIAQSNLCLVLRDGYPVSPGHTLIVPRRHVASFFDATAEERADMLRLLDDARLALDAELHPAGYNIGINDGAAAGQTVPHLHLHLIPRFAGDTADPRGGIRWIFPSILDLETLGSAPPFEGVLGVPFQLWWLDLAGLALLLGGICWFARVARRRDHLFGAELLGISE